MFECREKALERWPKRLEQPHDAVDGVLFAGR
jgi:hypothetical protein